MKFFYLETDKSSDWRAQEENFNCLTFIKFLVNS